MFEIRKWRSPIKGGLALGLFLAAQLASDDSNDRIENYEELFPYSERTKNDSIPDTQIPNILNNKEENEIREIVLPSGEKDDGPIVINEPDEILEEVSATEITYDTSDMISKMKSIISKERGVPENEDTISNVLTYVSENYNITEEEQLLDELHKYLFDNIDLIDHTVLIKSMLGMINQWILDNRNVLLMISFKGDKSTVALTFKNESINYTVRFHKKFISVIDDFLRKDKRKYLRVEISSEDVTMKLGQSHRIYLLKPVDINDVLYVSDTDLHRVLSIVDVVEKASNGYYKKLSEEVGDTK